jgi:hypothetical protein
MLQIESLVHGLDIQKLKFNVVKFIRERPFNLKRGGYGYFLKKNILIANVAEKNIPIFDCEVHVPMIQFEAFRSNIE